MLPEPIRKFISLFSDFPSVGPRQASRFAFWLIHHGPSVIEEYAYTLRELAQKIEICQECFYVFERSGNDRLCAICRDPKRARTLLAIVEKETDLISIEKTKAYRGLYHVLGDSINPLDQSWKQTLRIPSLVSRIEKTKKDGRPFEEIILALSTTTRGELTVSELERELGSLGTKITRLGRGLSRGAEVEFADEETLREALERRK